MLRPCRESNLGNADDLLRAELERQSEGDDCAWTSPRFNRRESGHAFFRYPAMMVPVIQRRLVDLVTNVQPGIRSLLDPFVGAGTSLTAGMHRGLDCYGQDVNPLAVLLSQVKAGPFYCDSLAQMKDEVLKVASSDECLRLEADFPNLEKWFQPNVAIELSRLRRAIRRVDPVWGRRFLWVVLAETIRRTSNDRTSTYKLHRRPCSEISERALSPIAVFSEVGTRSVTDLASFGTSLERSGKMIEGRFVGRVKLAVADTTRAIVLPDGPSGQQFDLVVTSPPYGDNTSTITYGQHSYLPLQWIDSEDIDSVKDTSYLRTTQEIDRRSLGGHAPSQAGQERLALGRASASLARVLAALADKPRDRAARVVSFYRDMLLALDQIVKVAANNAYLILTVANRHVGGSEVPNDQILIDLLDLRRVRLVSRIERQIHQKRMPTRNEITRTMCRESILIFRRLPDGEC